jgi:hypothetical protein
MLIICDHLAAVLGNPGVQRFAFGNSALCEKQLPYYHLVGDSTAVTPIRTCAAIVTEVGQPKAIRCDNGPELTSFWSVRGTADRKRRPLPLALPIPDQTRDGASESCRVLTRTNAGGRSHHRTYLCYGHLVVIRTMGY